MLQAQLSYFDAIVIGVMALSCLFAFFRGFVKEVLSLGAWIGAGVVTLYYFRHVAQWIKPHFKNEMIAGGMAALGLYIACLIGFSLINAIIIRLLKEGSDVGLLNNALGLGFGAARGAFLVSLGFLILSKFISPDPDRQPEWVKEAWTRPAAEKGAQVLARVAPDYLQLYGNKQKDGEKQVDGEEGEPPYSSFKFLGKKPVEPETEEGYSRASGEEIGKLIKHLKRKDAAENEQ